MKIRHIPSHSIDFHHNKTNCNFIKVSFNLIELYFKFSNKKKQLQLNLYVFLNNMIQLNHLRKYNQLKNNCLFYRYHSRKPLRVSLRVKSVLILTSQFRISLSVNNPCVGSFHIKFCSSFKCAPISRQRDWSHWISRSLGQIPKLNKKRIFQHKIYTIKLLDVWVVSLFLLG